MDPLTIAAASGLKTRMESLSLLANNLANAATSGYKVDREFYSLFSSSDADNPDGPMSTLPTVEKQWTDYTQGTLQPTNNPLDVAITGRGFLAVNSPTGVLYTRNGNLQLSPQGELQTSDGFAVRAAGGTSIKLQGGRDFEIAVDGTVRQDGVAVGQIEMVDFKSLDGLVKVSGTAFKNPDPLNKPLPATNAQLLQGRLEGSNVVVPEAAMRLVGVMRQFEMLQRAVTMGVEMNAKAIQEVARVGS